MIDESIAALAERLAKTRDRSLEPTADAILDQATGSGDDDMALLLIDFSRVNHHRMTWFPAPSATLGS